MTIDRRALRVVVVVGVAVAVVGLAWLGRGRLDGRATGYPSDGCKVSTGKADDGVLEAWAHCEWPLPAERVDSILSVFADQERHFGGIARSEVLRVVGDRTFVRQVQQASGISNREVVLEFVTEQIPNGHRYRWHKASDQSGRNPDHVECEVHEGSWEITRAADETIIEYHLRYLPGGSVPAFMVAAFLSSGVEDALGDLRQAASAEMVASRDGGN
jgi:hypothetical protein